jgi:hypothetical protein
MILLKDLPDNCFTFKYEMSKKRGCRKGIGTCMYVCMNKQMATKNIVFKFFCVLLLKVHIHQFS